MTDFAILRRLLRLCRAGISIGAAYTQVSVATGESRARVVDVYLKAQMNRLNRRWGFA